jgi:uncharacterized membrane protein (DUF485 family)
MAAAPRSPAAAVDPGTGHPANGHPQVDWEAIERSPEFRELTTKKRAFVVPATIFFLAWYFGFIILVGYAPDFMGSEFLVDGLTVGYVLAITQFVMTFVLGWMYIRRADQVFDPLAARVVERAGAMPPRPAEEQRAEGARAPTGQVAPR